MNRIEVACEGCDEPAWIRGLVDFADAALRALGKNDWDLSMLLCDDATMRDLNSRYRNKDEATDVLSFELGETISDEDVGDRWVAGDVVISLETLAKNAAYFSVPIDEELRRLALHGILHLSGMDHEDNDPGRPMLLLQERLLADLGDYRIMEGTSTK